MYEAPPDRPTLHLRAGSWAPRSERARACSPIHDGLPFQRHQLCWVHPSERGHARASTAIPRASASATQASNMVVTLSRSPCRRTRSGAGSLPLGSELRHPSQGPDWREADPPSPDARAWTVRHQAMASASPDARLFMGTAHGSAAAVATASSRPAFFGQVAFATRPAPAGAGSVSGATLAASIDRYALRYDQARKSSIPSNTSGMASPDGARKRWNATMFTITGARTARARGTKRPASRSALV